MLNLTGGRRVMLIGGEGVVLYGPSGRGVAREGSISWDVPNFEEQLATALSRGGSAKSMMLLFDGADQTYRKEEGIPKMSPIDRPRFIRRKLELAFPSYPIRAAFEIPPGRGKKRVRGTLPSFLFVALPETEQLDRIGTSLYESGVPVSGFGLLPAESAGLVSELAEKVFGETDKKSRWSVLIGQHETGGLRQVVVRDGNLALTRLTPTGDGGVNGAGWVEEVTREFKATLTYVSRFGFSQQDDALDVMVIAGAVEKQFFDQKDLGVTNFRCVPLSEALHHIGAPSTGLDKSNFSDALHAAWTGKKVSLKLPVPVPSIQRVMAPRQAARLGSVIMSLSAVGLIALTSQSYVSYESLQGGITDKQNQVAMLEREYAQESKIFESLPVKPEVAKAALSIKTLLENNSADVTPFLSTLKKTLGGDIRLNELSFTHTPGSGLNLTGAKAGGLFPTAPDPNDRGKVKIVFRFSLPSAMQLEDKVRRAEQIATDLRAAFPAHTVNIVSQFANVTAGGKFESVVGMTEQGQADGDAYAELSIEGGPL
jgi:hypothetical protein